MFVVSSLDSDSSNVAVRKKGSCVNIVPVDRANAEKSGVVDYDTDIGDDIEMSIPTDPEEKLCKGIRDGAALLGTHAGPELM